MKIIKNEKGITLIALVVTMIVIMILTVAFTANISSTMELNKYYRVKEDIIALTDEVQNYYNENGSLPVSGASFTFECTENPDEKNPNDNNKYYTIDTTLLDVDIQSKDSTYIVNQRSLTVYCKEGVILDNIIHYTIYEFAKVNYGDYLLSRNGSNEYFWKYSAEITEVNFETSINIPSSIEGKYIWDMSAD